MRKSGARRLQTRINRVIARQSSPIVVSLEVACHARGRGFESRRSRRKTYKTAYFVVTFENPIGRLGSKRSERNPRGAAVDAEADANLPGF